MAVAELVKEVKLRPQCFFCNKIVGDEAYCYGCREFVCAECDWTSPVSDHDVSKHQELEDEL